MAVSEAWIKHLFKRFEEIYGESANGIDKTLSNWVFALDGIDAEQIKYALGVCKQDTSVLPTAQLFHELCSQKSMSCNSPTSTDKPITALPSLGSVIPLQWPDKKLEAIKPVSNQLQKDWKQELLAMDETRALTELTHEQRYDRNRLLMEKQGREQVMRLQAIAPVNKPEIKRKDWG